MASWSSRRKFRIALSSCIIVVGLIVGIYLLFFYKAPTCFDRIQNGTETGIDCGGNCVKLCQSAYLPAQVTWGGGRLEQISPGFYNVAALITNPNTNAAAVNVPYKFSLYDSRGLLITERTGRTILPAQRNILVFESAVAVEKRIPTKVTFEFTAAPVWFKSHDTLGNLIILDKKYSEDEKNSSLEVSLQNKGQVPIKDITVGVILYDINSNAIGFSRTHLDSLGAGGRDIAPFTWPRSRQGNVVTIDALPVVAPVHN